jgi:hypothetical protein
MDAREMTCGQEIAADSEVPETLARLMNHVAANMELHASWVGAGGDGRREHDALMVVAREYRAIGDAASRAATAMKSMKEIPAPFHDPARLDRAGQIRWMRAKIHMQLDLARLLTEHADLSRMVLAKLEGDQGRPAEPR